MKKLINNYRIVKICELALFFVLECAFLIILISNKTMRSSIFVDRSLFILCTILYFTVLCAFLMLVHDFWKLKDLKREAHDLENLAFLDKKTGIPNRTGVNVLLDTYTTFDSMKGLACVMTEISNIKEINDVHGKVEGDKAISNFTALYEKCAEGYGFVGRNGGNEFITVIEKCNSDRISEYLSILNVNIDKYNESHPDMKLDIHSEYVLFDSEEVSSFSELVAKAYHKLGR